MMTPNPTFSALLTASHLECNHQSLLTHNYTTHFLCHYGAKTACLESFDLYNFYLVYWCWLEGNLIIFLPLFLVAIFFIFKYTSIAVDEYIAEGIQRISDAL